MKAELIDISECKKSFDIEIPQDVVDSEITRIARELARRAKVPGFRPGKAPPPVVKARYREEIVSEMVQHLLPKYFQEAVHERNLDIIEAPQYETIDYASGQPLRFKAIFEVYPQLDISNYTDIPAQEISTAVTAPEVEASLKKLQEDMSELTPAEEERPLREGDFAEISFHGRSTGEGSELEEPIVSDKAVVEIGGRTTLKEFTDNLLGASPNE